ncbi:hypothetical protein R1flu_011272 [Riccia fluitans]|uniref:Uncharacterized protein n=1 Tax=Riccia fluitans TaxID=41844 RepID=A0ABD1Z849_9MARC
MVGIKCRVVFEEKPDLTPNKDIPDEPSMPSRSPSSQPAQLAQSLAYKTRLHVQQQHQHVEAPKIISKAKGKGIFQGLLADKDWAVREKAELKKALRERANNNIGLLKNQPDLESIHHQPSLLHWKNCLNPNWLNWLTRLEKTHAWKWRKMRKLNTLTNQGKYW